jgi:O-antigen ligase
MTVRPLSRFNRGITVMVMLVWPVAFIVAKRFRPVFAAIPLLIALKLSFHLETDAGQWGMLASLIIFAIGWLAPTLFARIAAVLAFGGILLMPTLVPLAQTALDGSPGTFKVSAYHRAAIWQFTVDRIDERPLLGWGLDSSRNLPGGSDRVEFHLPNGSTLGGEKMPLHPHNFALQWRLELGFIGTMLGGLILAVLFWRLGNPAYSRGARAAGLAMLSAASLMMMVTYGAWQYWWLVSMLLCGGLLTMVVQDRRLPEPDPPSMKWV